MGKPRCARILPITAESSMAARSVKGPPHCGQVVMSMAKMRLSNWAQLRRARVEAGGRAPVSLEEADAWSRSPGTIWDRSAALGANTPWKRMRWSRGWGMSAAKRCRNSSGVMTRWVVPSRRDFELEYDHAGRGGAQPFVSHSGTCDVATQTFECLPLLVPTTRTS